MKLNKKIEMHAIQMALVLIGLIGAYTLFVEGELAMAVYLFIAGMGIYAIFKFLQGNYFLDEF